MTSRAHLKAIALPLLLSALACTPADGPRPRAEAKGQLHLVDIAAAAGLTQPQVGGGPNVDYIIDSIGTGAAWLDFDLDGDPDLYLAQGATPAAPRNGPPDLLYRNDGDPDGDGVPSFTEVGEAAGLGDRLWSFGVATADYDNDGDPDLFLANWGANRLYRNNGDGTFTEIAAQAGVDDPRWAVSAVWGDLERDGDLDLYVTNYVDFTFERYPARGEPGLNGVPPCAWKGVEVYCGPRNLVPQHDAIYRNEGDPDGDGVPTFVDVTQGTGLATNEAYYGLAAHFFDADRDGDDDLYVANDSVQNTYFLNRGDGTFEEQAILSGLAYNEQGHEQAGMGVSSGDYNRDGRLDLAVSNFSHDHDTLYRNDGALFTDVSYPSGIGTPSYLTLGWGIAFGDLDHDGWEDLFVAHGHVYPQIDRQRLGTQFNQQNAIFRNLGDGRFEDATATAGDGLAVVSSSRAVLPIDLEPDGDLDILVTNLNAPPLLLRNDGAPGNWLQLELHGSTSNVDGIGAWVELVSSGETQVREMRSSGSFAGSTLARVHFGLGQASHVERIEIHWPSGAKSELDNVEANQLLTVREP